MIIRTAGGGDAEVHSRDMFSGADVIPLPGQAFGSFTSAGKRITAQTAAGLPPMLRGIRVLAETVATLPLLIYRGQKPERIAEPTAPQLTLLARKPNELQTPFDFVAYIIASMLGFGNAYILKAKSREKVEMLYSIDPSRVTPKVKGTEITYEVRRSSSGEKAAKLTREDIIHIPGILLQDPYIGVSPIIVAANAMGTALAAEDFAGRFFDNDATPPGVLEFPQAGNSQAARDTREAWEDRHRGSRNSHRVGALFGGAKYQRIGVDAAGAQIVETQKWNVEQTANVLGLPNWVLGGKDENPRSTPEQRNTEMLQYALAPWLVRVEQGLHADDDLFPDKDLAPAFLADGMLRSETGVRYAAYTQGRQAGWLSINDVRRMEGMPPIPGGDDYQITPVGGAPNLQPGAEPDGVEPASPVT